MDGAADCGALCESLVFLAYFTGLNGPRQKAKVIYPLNEVLLLCLLAVLAGAETFTDVALFGEKKLDLLRRLLPYRNGTPPHDRLGEIFAVLDAEAFQRCFVSWVAAITKIPAEFIAIDGKTSRRSFKKRVPTMPSTWFPPLPLSNAWCWAKRRWMRNRMRSWLSLRFWRCFP
jgi:DDE_Tnp_1-associated